MVLTGAVSPLALALVTQLSPSTVPLLTWYIPNPLGSARAMTMSMRVPSYLSLTLLNQQLLHQTTTASLLRLLSHIRQMLLLPLDWNATIFAA
ncbi:hypothetical protein DSO57_1036842 [Entomophthora muscae]|uniref:Uncharacterized protein n=1 Tax=Entomophthora muscae TaxID=34485 RepID=A0ACC2SNB3_9FUNG|nr:hypothetical protein DSO57_1036842 [Entomophthora muscae]